VRRKIIQGAEAMSESQDMQAQRNTQLQDLLQQIKTIS
jgi:hypothetical protein